MLPRPLELRLFEVDALQKAVAIGSLELRAIDAHTAVDAQLFAEALRLLLGRLRTLEEQTGRSLLACVDWAKLWRSTGHIDGLWESKEAFVAA